jgi:hypothetical protein
VPKIFSGCNRPHQPIIPNNIVIHRLHTHCDPRDPLSREIHLIYDVFKIISANTIIGLTCVYKKIWLDLCLKLDQFILNQFIVSFFINIYFLSKENKIKYNLFFWLINMFDSTGVLVTLTSKHCLLAVNIDN